MACSACSCYATCQQVGSHRHTHTALAHRTRTPHSHTARCPVPTSRSGRTTHPELALRSCRDWLGGGGGLRRRLRLGGRRGGPGPRRHRVLPRRLGIRRVADCGVRSVPGGMALGLPRPAIAHRASRRALVLFELLGSVAVVVGRGCRHEQLGGAYRRAEATGAVRPSATAAEAFAGLSTATAAACSTTAMATATNLAAAVPPREKKQRRQGSQIHAAHLAPGCCFLRRCGGERAFDCICCSVVCASVLERQGYVWLSLWKRCFNSCATSLATSDLSILRHEYRVPRDSPERQPAPGRQLQLAWP